MNGRFVRAGGMRARGMALVGAAVVAIAIQLATAATTAAQGRFPVPSCRWVPTSLVNRTFDLSVRELKPIWSTDVAPVLSCGWVERVPKLQQQGQPIVIVQFRELQRFTTKGFSYVPHLGSCIDKTSCPQPGKAAWVLTASGLALGQEARPFTSGIELRVEDGLNMLRIDVLNPNGPLPVRNGVAATEVLARKLLGHFRWK